MIHYSTANSCIRQDKDIEVVATNHAPTVNCPVCLSVIGHNEMQGVSFDFVIYDELTALSSEPLSYIEKFINGHKHDSLLA